MERRWQAKIFGSFLLTLFFVWNAAASPTALTYQGRIVNADGKPLNHSNVSFQFEITNPAGTCVLYREQVDGINMANSNGVFDVAIGNSHGFPSAPSFTVLDAFNNTTSFSCDGGAPYNASATDGRKLRVQFHDGSSWKLISPDSLIRSVPFAAQSANSVKLGNYVANDFVRKVEVNGNANCAAGSFLTWNAGTGTFGCAAAPTGGGGGSGTVTEVTSANAYLGVTNGTSTPQLTINVGQVANTVAAGNDPRFTNPRAPNGSATGDLSGTYPSPTVAQIQGIPVDGGAPILNQVLTFDGTKWIGQALPAGNSGTVTNIATGTGLSGGPITSTGTISLGAPLLGLHNMATNGYIYRNGANTYGATLGATNASASNLVMRDGSGMSSFYGVNFAGNTSGSVTLKAADISGSYTLTLPDAAGAANQTLVTSGATGILSWANIPSAPGAACSAGDVLTYNGSSFVCVPDQVGSSGGGIVSLNGLTDSSQSFATPGTAGTAPAWSSATGVHTLNIPLAANAGVTAGLLSKAQYDVFNAKQPAGNYITTLTGDVTSSGFSAGSITTTISNLDASKITSGVLAPARLGTGTADTTKYLRGDGAWTTFPTFTETDPKVGANTTNYLSKWNGTALVASGVYESGGNVGIGTASPQRKLHVRADGAYQMRIENGDTGGGYWHIGQADNAFGTGGGRLLFVPDSGVSTDAKVVFTNAGSVGIGTYSPSAKLEVAGQVKITGGSPGANKVLTSDAAGLATWQSLPAASNVDLSTAVTGVLPIANGGTNSSTALNSNRLMASVSGAIKELGAMTNGQIVVGQTSAAPQIVSVSGDASLSQTGALTLGTGSVNSAKILDGSVSYADLNFAGTMTTNTGLLVTDGTQFYNKTCSGNQTLIWTVANGWSCSDVVLSESDPKVGTNTTNYLSKWNGSSLSSSAIYESAGQVGIGTSSPTQKLSVAGVIQSTTGGIMFPDGTTQTTAATTSGTNNTLLSGLPDVILCTNPSGSGLWALYNIGYQSGVSNAVIYGVITTNSYWVTVNSSTNTISSITGSWTPANCAVGTTISSLYSAGRALNLAKGPAAQWLQSGSNAYYNAGNVGIGTATPTAALHVTSPTYPPLRVDRTIAGTTGSYALGFLVTKTTGDMTDGFGAHLDFGGADDAGVDNLFGRVGAVRDTADNKGALVFHTSNGSGTAERARIANDGKVGIGTTSPGQALTVAGTIESTSGGVKFPDASTQATSAFGPSFCAKITTTAGTANSVTIKAPFDTVEFDTDSNYSTTNRRFTPSKAGYYRVSAFITVSQAPTTALTNVLYLYKSGTAIRTVQRLINYASSYSDTMNIDTMIYMNGTTDYLEIYFNTNATATGTLVAGTGSGFCAEWVRP